MLEHDKTIEVIMSILKRYNLMMPDIFKKLNAYEKELAILKPRHTFSKQDCRYIMEQSDVTPMIKNRFDIISEVLLLLYNWYKSKQIYHIEDEMSYKDDVYIDREKLKLFPYSGIYLNLEFYSLEYVGCFITMTREPKGSALRRYIVIGFVEYDKKINDYTIEPFMIEVQDGIKVEDAFMKWYNDNPFPAKYIKRNLIASFIAVANLYLIIDVNNKDKEVRKSSIKRKITEKVLSADMEDDSDRSYRISNESKYKYESASMTKGTGSPKAPHMRRTHPRHLKIKDDEGNIIGEKTITIKEMKIHPEQENNITIRNISQ